jgi:hypothetical protein
MVSIGSFLTKWHTFVVTLSLCSVKDVQNICRLLQMCAHFWSYGTTQSLCMAYGLPLKGSIKHSISFSSCFFMLCTKFGMHFILSDVRCAVHDSYFCLLTMIISGEMTAVGYWWSRAYGNMLRHAQKSPVTVWHKVLEKLTLDSFWAGLIHTVLLVLIPPLPNLSPARVFINWT